jgi:uncharacterized protein
VAKVKRPVTIDAARARRLWLHASRLDTRAPFGAGPEAARAAIEHLGYVQIDTIHVIERAHHHQLFTRIPDYRRADLAALQSDERSVFEYWTHALSYVPTRDLKFFVPQMAAHRARPSPWFGRCTPEDLEALLTHIRKEGPVSIRDVDGDVRVEKDHPWASTKPSKRVLELGFYNGDLVISRRDGMVKTYELLPRHFGLRKHPKPATEDNVAEYLLARGLRAQGLVNGSSLMHPRLTLTPRLAELVEKRVKGRKLVPVRVDGWDSAYWAERAIVDTELPALDPELAHILSPFDPLVIQRGRLAQFFGYEHVFEAYVSKDKRRFGYFTLPVLVGDRFVAVLDLKTDRAAGRVLVQAWHWLVEETPRLRQIVEDELTRFERFQLGK